MPGSARSASKAWPSRGGAEEPYKARIVAGDLQVGGDVVHVVDRMIAPQSMEGRLLSRQACAEVEWEFACRAGVTGPRYGELDAIAWHVGTAWDWVGDPYTDCTRSPRTNPTGPATGTQRTIRGRNFKIDRGFSRASHRDHVTASDFASSTGLRIARTP